MCVLLLMVLFVGNVMAAPLIRGSEKMKLNTTKSVEKVVLGDNGEMIGQSLMIAVVVGLLMMTTVLFILYMRVKKGSGRIA
jgi:ABC-type Fe3+ transport system permease subunit